MKGPSSILRGQRATWPKIALLDNHMCIEIKLDDIARDLEYDVGTRYLRLVCAAAHAFFAQRSLLPCIRPGASAARD